MGTDDFFRDADEQSRGSGNGTEQRGKNQDLFLDVKLVSKKMSEEEESRMS